MEDETSTASRLAPAADVWRRLVALCFEAMPPRTDRLGAGLVIQAGYSLILTLAMMTVGCATKAVLPPPRHVAARLDPQYPLDLLKYYPIPSRDLGEEGTCLVNVWVHPDGAVHATQIRQTSGFATLDDACIKMMLDARFLPAQNERGQAIASWVTVPIVWKVDRNIPPAIVRGYVLEVGDDYYPAAARKLHQEGDCIVGIFINSNGVGIDPYIYQSTGSAVLDEACIRAVSKVPFTPAIRNGVPTGAPLRIPISWRLGKY